MAIKLAGSEPDIATGSFAVNSSGDYHDNDAVRCALGVWGSGETIVITLSVEAGADSTAGWWLHAYGQCGSGMYDAAFDREEWFLVKDGSGNNVVASSTVNDASITFTAYGSSGGTAATATWASGYNQSIGKTLDVHCYKSGSDTKLDVYANTILVATATVTGETNRGIKQILLGGPSLSTAAADQYRFWWSEFIVADEDTRNFRVGIYYPSADGTHTDGTGTYANIDEITTDANAIILAAATDRQSWGVTMHGAHPAGGIKAICVNGLVASDGTNDMQASIRIGSTDYDSADLTLTASPAAISTVWNTNPATSAPWGAIDPTTLEFGYEAVT